MFTSKQLVAFVKSMLGMPYWYGTCVYPCTQSLLTRKSKQYPSHYGASRMAKYKAAIAAKKVCMDCVGMIKGFFWTNGGQGVRAYIDGGPEFINRYASNGCPDKSANGMLEWLKKKGCKHGKIATLPDVPGILLFSPGHVGVYVGGGKAVEARGFKYGVVETRVKDRGWTEWAYLPETLLRYEEDASSVGQSPAPSSQEEGAQGSRILKRGMKGADVVVMQEALLLLGYALPRNGADGDFGAETEKAVKAFQKASGLEADGEFGPLSHAAMVKALEALDQALQHAETTPRNPKVVAIVGGNCYARNAPSREKGAVLGVATKGSRLSYRGEKSDNGWLAVVFDGKDAWVSGRYGKLVDA